MFEGLGCPKEEKSGRWDESSEVSVGISVELESDQPNLSMITALAVDLSLVFITPVTGNVDITCKTSPSRSEQ